MEIKHTRKGCIAIFTKAEQQAHDIVISYMRKLYKNLENEIPSDYKTKERLPYICGFTDAIDKIVKAIKFTMESLGSGNETELKIGSLQIRDCSICEHKQYCDESKAYERMVKAYQENTERILKAMKMTIEEN